MRCVWDGSAVALLLGHGALVCVCFGVVVARGRYQVVGCGLQRLVVTCEVSRVASQVRETALACEERLMIAHFT